MTKTILNQYQLAKLGKPKPPRPILKSTSDLCRDDPDITRENLERMMRDYFKAGGTIKVLNESGEVVRETK